MTVNNLSGYFRDQRWLTAHNAWNTNQNPGNNQSKTLTELLDYGVRGLALDIYSDKSDKLYLSHGRYNMATSIDWSIILAELKAWLSNNPQEIVTLFFESYLPGSVSGTLQNPPPPLVLLEASLATIPCYMPGRAAQESAIAGRTLSQLITSGQRLFAFIEREPDEGSQAIFPVMTKTFTENVYGGESLYAQTWANLREGSSPDNPLTFMNHFGDTPVASWWVGNGLQKVLNQADCFAFKYGGRYPNFISLDRIEWTSSNDGPIEIVNALRRKPNLHLNIIPFQWEDQNDFDEVIFSISDTPIQNFILGVEEGAGITRIEPVGQPPLNITGIQLINSSGVGIVNMRLRVDSTWYDWKTPYETDKDVNGSNITMGTYDLEGPLVGIVVRKQKGIGVTDLATATLP